MSFIRDFLESVSGSECPRDYALWSAYAALSIATGRRAFYDFEQFSIVPNLYIVLVGPAGNRKTFARDKAIDLLTEVMPDSIVSAECETKQGITKFLSSPEQLRTYVDYKGQTVETRPYGVFASELMNYLALDPAGMITFLTDVHDRKYYRYRIKNEEHTLVNPYVVILACSTPDWLTRQLRSDDFCSGFGRRTVFVCNDSDERRHPTLNESAKEALERCKTFLKKFSKRQGFEFKLTPAAYKWFWGNLNEQGVGDGWYFTYKLSDDKFLRSWGRSKHILMFKVAMLTSISEDDAPVIDLKHLQLSLGVLDEVEKNLPMITSRIGRSEITEPIQNLLDYVRYHGGAVEEKILRKQTMKHFKTPMEQIQVIEWLKQTEQLVVAAITGKAWLALPDCPRLQRASKATEHTPPSSDVTPASASPEPPDATSTGSAASTDPPTPPSASHEHQ